MPQIEETVTMTAPQIDPDPATIGSKSVRSDPNQTIMFSGGSGGGVSMADRRNFPLESAPTRLFLFTRRCGANCLVLQAFSETTPPIQNYAIDHGAREMETLGFLNQYDTSTPYDHTVDNLSVHSFSSESYTEYKECFTDRSNDHNASNINTRCQTPMTLAATSLSSSNTFTISFGEQNPKDHIPTFNDSRGVEISGTGKVQDHVLAERKRREKLNRHLISLSALLPNLKKMDKASVLEDAKNYIRELEDRVKQLEGMSGIIKTDAKECIIASNRSRIRGDDDDDSSSNETNSAEIEVRMSGSSVLVRIQSQKNSSLLVKVLSRMQKLGLSIISSSVMPFANTTTLITVVAQIEGDFSITATHLVKNLQLAV
ncbi:hypothetical protein L1987_51395 [Smallanthus sonchifolius]|uniref:Uncharacterized protein n=1 Tax=Smallanthus sonchifolius TaxID=185202 RepID=A0ACB9ERB2_9ASTR|nr:hypothetical protein L1987_51395 [Smallanthus sonchifolius]